jgi:hypothetical protein
MMEGYPKMKDWLKTLFLPIFLTLIVSIVPAGIVLAATDPVEVVRVRQTGGAGMLYLSQLRGMVDSKAQATLNAGLEEAIVSLGNPLPKSSLNGDFSINFYNQSLLGIHFQGYSFTKGTAHPNKIDQGIHLDLETGKLYKLADLFIAGVDYVGRINELCQANSGQYRVHIDELWDGWKHEDFVSSWRGSDAAFLLSAKAIRVYSIPRYATGAISGYTVPYTDLMDIIDHNGSLWRKIQSRPATEIAIVPDNVIDKTRVKVGDVYAGLTVTKVELRSGSLRDVLLAGEKELTGVSEWSKNSGDGAGYVFLVDESEADTVPVLKGYEQKTAFILTLPENSPELPKEKVRVRIRVKNFSLGERQVMARAQLVKVIATEPF